MSHEMGFTKVAPFAGWIKQHLDSPQHFPLAFIQNSLSQLLKMKHEQMEVSIPISHDQNLLYGGCEVPAGQDEELGALMLGELKDLTNSKEKMHFYTTAKTVGTSFIDTWGIMNEEEQFVSIDLNDDNICSVCKLGTDKETLSFCHVCFELNIDGIPKSDLLHTKSLRGHKDCFEKYHLIANQDCPRSKLSKSTYEEVKTILSKKINWIVQYAQNRDLDSDSECSKNPQHHLFNFRHKPDKKLLPQFDSQVPKYSAKWIEGNAGGLSNCTQRMLEQRENTGFGLAVLQDSGTTLCHNSVLWPHSHNREQKKEKTISGPEAHVQTQHPHYSREELNSMTLGEVKQLNAELQQQIQEVFEELTHQVQEKDSLASELHVRHVAIEQLLKNYSKLPCLQMGRTGLKSHLPINN
ncbi:hypothetical protein JEQ12_001253 [Ovis aries]|uniref:Protein EURL homolog n=3 Tax=Ovis aries TaxID=9940 RepID=A0A836DA40_SHEEP|nr:hypothetical protein JEQ12_001253 [Ovis aries]